MAKVKVTRNYQVTIPESVRKRLSIREGDYVSFEVSGEGEAILKRALSIEDLASVWDEEMDPIMEDVKKIWKTWKV